MEEERDLNAEGLAPGYDVYRGNAETIRICLENEKKEPIPFPDDILGYFKELYGFDD